jgi:hypothetical protein
MNVFARSIAVFTAACLATTGVAYGAPLALISTEQAHAVDAGQPTSAAEPRARLHAALDREDLAAALKDRGVSLEQLRARVDALTDAEARQLLAQIDAAPAGADILGTLFTVFVILLVTDILGFTKVFPFTRSVR